MLRDHLVCSINDKALQRKLLAEPDLTYSKAIEIAQRNELAAQQVKDIRRGHDMIIDCMEHTKGKGVTVFDVEKEDMWSLNAL